MKLQDEHYPTYAEAMNKDESGQVVQEEESKKQETVKSEDRESASAMQKLKPAMWACSRLAKST